MRRTVHCNAKHLANIDFKIVDERQLFLAQRLPDRSLHETRFKFDVGHLHRYMAG